MNSTKNTLAFSNLIVFTLILCCGFHEGQAQEWKGKFEQLGQDLPTPNSYRSGSGKPGPSYWQQRADYVIDVELNDETQVISGKETITYHNNSLEALSFIWLQLDQNKLQNNSIANLSKTNAIEDSLPAKLFAEEISGYVYEGGYKIHSVTGPGNAPLNYTINQTMMRIDLPSALKTGEKFVFNVAWQYLDYDRMKIFDERGGYEFFPEDGNYVYTVAHWYPRLCVFDDYEGWQNKQFLGDGEFALTFGDFLVRITVPSDHIVGATGWLQNPTAVLTLDQQKRFALAQKTFDRPVLIVTEDEARQKEKQRSSKKSTWVFKADNVRDFAFASSRKFIWDAMAVKTGTKTPLAQSLYPKEGNPLWARESTKAIKNALEVYSARTFDYPYPTAYSIHTADIGMEYPMICFNHGRPDKNGKYSARTVEGMIGVIVHEVGHNFFPMIVNSDERQWTWMDEGLNSFLEGETIRERYPELDYQDGLPSYAMPYMRGDKTWMRPIMSMADNQGDGHGPNGYFKPAAALHILRNTVMGPALFDKAFKEYSLRWMFKHPKPADFFRTMEDASAVDLDWFWRGWFYTTDHVDVEINDVQWFRLSTQQNSPEQRIKQVKRGKMGVNNNGKGFGDEPKEFTLADTPESLYRDFRSRINDNEVRQSIAGKNLYQVTFKNKGGLVMPIIIEWTFEDGSKEIERIPAEIWRLNETEVTKVFIKEKKAVGLVFDPYGEMADVDPENNVFPPQEIPSNVDKFRKR